MNDSTKDYFKALPKNAFIRPVSVVKTLKTAKEKHNTLAMPFHALGYVTKGSGTLQRTDCIFKYKCVYDGSNITAFIEKKGNREIEIYNTKKDDLTSIKKQNIPTASGTVGIVCDKLSPSIKNFKVSLNATDAVVPKQHYCVGVASPAIPAIMDKEYFLGDFCFDFSSKVQNVKGHLIKWSSLNDELIVKNGTFKACGKGVYTLCAEYLDFKKKIFVVTNQDSQNDFVLFNFDFKNWHSENNPFTVKNFMSGEDYSSLVAVETEGIFKNFANFKIVNRHFAILLNSDIVKHFSDYTLSCEMFINRETHTKDRGVGFIARLNDNAQPTVKCKFLCCNYTLDYGLQITSHEKTFTSKQSRTCSGQDIEQIKTRDKDDARANFRIPLNNNWCFYLPKGGEYRLESNGDQELEYIILTFDTNIEIPEFAHKLFFHFEKDKITFQNILREKNYFGLIEKCFGLFKILSLCKSNTYFRSDSISESVKFLVEDADWEDLGNLSVEDIARKLSISHSYLCAVFKKETGTTVQQYISDFKLETAKISLRVFPTDTEESANYWGYSSYRAFSRAFKKKFGITPKHLMENH